MGDNMRRVILESPYAGNVDLNVAYLNTCIAHALEVGDAPVASHRLYPGILDDNLADQRALGMAAGHAWICVAEAMVVYTDLGVSPGMLEAMRLAHGHGIPIERRTILGPKAAQ